MSLCQETLKNNQYLLLPIEKYAPFVRPRMFILLKNIAVFKVSHNIIKCLQTGYIQMSTLFSLKHKLLMVHFYLEY